MRTAWFVLSLLTQWSVVLSAVGHTNAVIGNFTARERKETLAQYQVDATPLGFYDSEKTEIELVEVALRELHDVQKARGKALGARCLAMLWEEMTAQIDGRLGYAHYSVSRGYLWIRGAQTIYVYQGPLTVGPELLHPTLIIFPDTSLAEGLSKKIENIDRWDGNFRR